jgi:zinc transporter ZupT
VALIGWAILVGASLVAGALVAVVLRLPERIAAVVTSFGGGLLVAAIAFELVPEADERSAAIERRGSGGRSTQSAIHAATQKSAKQSSIFR